MSDPPRAPDIAPATEALVREVVFANANRQRWWAVDHRGRLVQFSETFAADFRRAFGIELRCGTNMVDESPGHDHALWRTYYAEALRGERTRADYVARGPEGIRHYELEFVRAAGDGVDPIVVAFSRDVTELRASESRTRALLATHPDVLFVVDREGRILDAYGEANDHDALAAHAVGSTLADVLPPEAGASALEAARRLEPRGSAAPFSFELRDANSIVNTYDVRMSRAGEGAEILVVITDTTRAHLLQSRLVAAERLASMGVVAAAVAHEINNPLAYALGNVETALAQLPAALDLEDLRRALEDASDGIRRVAGIVRDLRAHTPRGGEERSPLDLTTVVRSVVRLMRRQWPTDVELELRFDQVPKVVAVESRLAQVVSNLLRNAVEAARDAERDRRVIVRVGTTGSWVTLEVEDSGRGVPPALRSRLFQQFASGRAGEGTGLGLWISAGIVAEHGGEITALEGAAGGALFRVSLPVASEGSLEARTRPPTTAPPSARRRVLVVDDEEKLCQVIVRMLREHEVTTAAGAEAALELLQRDADFDVVLCDVTMAGTNGIELRDEVARRWPALRDGFVLMTGGVGDASLASAIDAAPLVLEKPFDPITLRTMVDHAASMRDAVALRPPKI